MLSKRAKIILAIIVIVVLSLVIGLTVYFVTLKKKMTAAIVIPTGSGGNIPTSNSNDPISDECKKCLNYFDMNFCKGLSC